MGAGAVVSATAAATVVAKPAAGGPDAKKTSHLKYRPNRRYRYPWWVKTVDRMTTETDDAITVRPDLSIIAYGMAMETERWLKDNILGATFAIENIKNNVPGHTLKDFALHYACGTFFREGLGWAGPPVPGMWDLNEGADQNVHPPQEMGLPPWQGTPEEASDMLEAAGVQLGSAMVGFTTVNPLWFPSNVRFSSSADTIQSNDHLYKSFTECFDGNVRDLYKKDIPKILERVDRWKKEVMNNTELSEMVLPERFRYVIAGKVPRPYDLVVRANSELGTAGDRVGFEASYLARRRMINFIRGLGYDAVRIPGENPVPWAVAAGLGEMGRQNRLISPVFGGNVNLWAVVTDLPVAPDRPIDFGLQTFCRNCRKCAEACPSGAVSKDDDPTWTPKGIYQAAGKKVYFENSDRCMTWLNQHANLCGVCMASCPWSKQEKAALHSVSRLMAAKAGRAGKLLRKMDDAFGYEIITKDDPEMAEWWDLNIPIAGIDSWQGKL